MFKTQQPKTQLFLFLFIALWLLTALMIQPVVFAAEGKLVFDKVHSPAIEGNLLGNPAERSVTIYLPPDYDENSNKRYPVVYLLHGYTGTNHLWTGGGYLGGGFNVKNMSDFLIQQGQIKPMIFVMPDAHNNYRGSYYTNSSATGNYEDFITKDLVKYIDKTYRTLPQAASRGIGGHSMGGYGSLKLAMKHPELYSAVYGMSGGPIGFDKNVRIQNKNAWIATFSLKEINQFGGAPFDSQAQIAYTAAFSPNPNRPPLFVDFPFELVGEELKRVEPVWQKWLAHDPVLMINSHQANLRKFRAIRFDCGISDNLIEGLRLLSQAFTAAGISHVFEEYEGDHTNRIRERTETKVLPFFSDVLAFEMLPTVSVQPHGKLTTTWGEIKRSQ